MDKIITKVNLDVETQEFDELIAVIKDEIERLGVAMMKGQKSAVRGTTVAIISDMLI